MGLVWRCKPLELQRRRRARWHRPPPPADSVKRATHRCRRSAPWPSCHAERLNVWPSRLHGRGKFRDYACVSRATSLPPVRVLAALTGTAEECTRSNRRRADLFSARSSGSSSTSLPCAWQVSVQRARLRAAASCALHAICVVRCWFRVVCCVACGVFPSPLWRPATPQRGHVAIAEQRAWLG